MAVVLLSIMLIGLLLIATEPLHRVNKAAVAMFFGVTCWLLYIAYSNTFVSGEYTTDYQNFLSQCADSRLSTKQFVASNIFFKYVVQSANIVLFLLSTTCIVEVLNNNGCFDFLAEWIKTRKPRKMLWLLAFFTFIISANLDNLATVVLLFSIIHPLLQSAKQRRIYGAVIILAANCGGAITVIGDMTSLKLWTDGLVTPSTFFLTLVLPVCAALCTILWLLMRDLPSRVELSMERLPYRGDDTLLSRPKRMLMLFVGIGGLWFIPSFHRITLLPPFVGALCVLALLWIVNELCNRQLLGSDKMVLRRLPMALQYANLQNMLFFIGLILMFGAVDETGIIRQLYESFDLQESNVYVVGIVSTILSSLLGHVPTLIGSIDLFAHTTSGSLSALVGIDGYLWPMISYATVMGGSMLLTGSISGILFMRMEEVNFGWYLRHIVPKVIIGFAVGFVLLALIIQGVIYFNN